MLKKAQLQVIVLVCVLLVSVLGLYFVFKGVGRAYTFDDSGVLVESSESVVVVPGEIFPPDDWPDGPNRINPGPSNEPVNPGPPNTGEDSGVEPAYSKALPNPPGVSSSCSLICRYDGRNAVFEYSPKFPQCPQDFTADCDYAYTDGSAEFKKFVNSKLDECCALPAPKVSSKPEPVPVPGEDAPSAPSEAMPSKSPIIGPLTPITPLDDEVICSIKKETNCIKPGFIKTGSLGTKFENPEYSDTIIQTPSPPCPPSTSTMPYTKNVFTDVCKTISSCGIEAQMVCNSGGGSFTYQSREDASGFPCDNTWKPEVYKCSSISPLTLPLPGGVAFKTTLKGFVGDRAFNACCGKTSQGSSAWTSSESNCKVSASFGVCVYNVLLKSPPFEKQITISDSCSGVTRTIQYQCTCSELLAQYGQCGSSTLASASIADPNALKVQQSCCGAIKLNP